MDRTLHMNKREERMNVAEENGFETLIGRFIVDRLQIWNGSKENFII